ncbi:hypothetical protein CVT26_005619 [Gymnopilus dilepis]|uniref:Uncharacterized protein n=1 Tax=Gymnopilus dilepis TaxID=231916 RepID=A0A409XZK1_9AGAR|nr:hypothetical protein CVT26_005619 [Gymnopilus dilepis]
MHPSPGIFFIITSLFGIAVRADLVAFTGSTCDGDEGKNVPCDDSCHLFTDRNSFVVLASGTHCVVIFEDTKCTVPVGLISNAGGGTCSRNVNTGTTMGSFRCSPNRVCDNAAAQLTSKPISG